MPKTRFKTWATAVIRLEKIKIFSSRILAYLVAEPWTSSYFFNSFAMFAFTRRRLKETSKTKATIKTSISVTNTDIESISTSLSL